MISSAFLRALKDPFPPARQAGVLGMAATQNFFTLNEIAQRLLPAMCSMTRDPEKGVRDQVTNISKKSVYSKTRLIRHLCNLFPCVICHWFSCLFFFINFNVFYTVYSDTLCILTQTISPCACLFRQVSLYSVWYHIITNLDSVLSRILFILDISSPIYFFSKSNPPPPFSYILNYASFGKKIIEPMASGLDKLYCIWTCIYTWHVHYFPPSTMVSLFRMMYIIAVTSQQCEWHLSIFNTF